MLLSKCEIFDVLKGYLNSENRAEVFWDVTACQVAKRY
jgi:hypothetical protein